MPPDAYTVHTKEQRVRLSKVGARFKNVGRSWQTTHAGAGLLRPTLRVDAARYRRAASVRHARRAARERARLRAARHAALRCCIFAPH